MSALTAQLPIIATSRPACWEVGTVVPGPVLAMKSFESIGRFAANDRLECPRVASGV
jgi:energy-converting hydrogenase Eha subunit A